MDKSVMCPVHEGGERTAACVCENAGGEATRYAGGHPGGHLGGHPSGHPVPHAGGHPGGHPGGRPGGHASASTATIPVHEGGIHYRSNTSDPTRAYRPGAGAAARAYEERTGIKPPKIIAWEITRSCNLACAHCRAAAHCAPYPGELSLDQCKAVIDDIATITDPILILTGGEPLMRADIWDIIDYAHEKGLHPVIGTNGTIITDEIARKIYEHNIPRVAVSLDFPNEAGQDAFRGKDGAFEETLAGIRNMNKYGIGVQVNTTVTKMNHTMMDELHDLALDNGAVAFHPFLLVPTGRGADLLDVELTPDEYEEVLRWAFERQQSSPMHFKPTDSPQYYRILRQQAAAQGIKVSPATYGMEAMTRGCLGGITFAFISHVGQVQPCGYFDMNLGNVTEIPFSEIWTHSPVFENLRHYERLKGKCGACEYKSVCGGCRARALSLYGDYMQEEPYCAYTPKKRQEELVLSRIQVHFPLTPRPLETLADELGLSADQVRETLEHLYAQKKIRRIGASFTSHKLGYVSCLCALAIEGGSDDIQAAARVVSSYPQVTHNYGRDNRYNIWFTLIARSRAQRDRIFQEIVQKTGCHDALKLAATRTFKIQVQFNARKNDEKTLHKPMTLLQAYQAQQKALGSGVAGGGAGATAGGGVEGDGNSAGGGACACGNTAGGNSTSVGDAREASCVQQQVCPIASEQVKQCECTALQSEGAAQQSLDAQGCESGHNKQNDQSSQSCQSNQECHHSVRAALDALHESEQKKAHEQAILNDDVLRAAEDAQHSAPSVPHEFSADDPVDTALLRWVQGDIMREQSSNSMPAAQVNVDAANSAATPAPDACDLSGSTTVPATHAAHGTTTVPAIHAAHGVHDASNAPSTSTNASILEAPFADAVRFVQQHVPHASLTEQDVCDRLKGWCASKTIRRFGAMVKHQNMGYTANSMTVWRFAPEDIERAGAVFAHEAVVSHCYARETAPTWEYNMYAMIHGHTKAELEATVERMKHALSEAHVPVLQMSALQTTCEFKKTSMRYFEEDNSYDLRA